MARSLLLALALAGLLGSGAAAAKPGGCVPPGAWVDPFSGEQRADAVAALAARNVVLLGERHDAVEDHRWQLRTAAALFERRPDMQLGFEMFPRRAQPVLDRWVGGGLDEAAFLREVRWKEIWGADPALYLPLFRFARDHRVPMLALNVDRATIRRISAEGLAAVPAAAREGIGDPAPAAAGYRDRLYEAFREHPGGGQAGIDSDAFGRFVGAQLFWDRAMAEAIAGALRKERWPLVVAIMGRGHVEYRQGVAHQLAALGVANVATALPWPPDADCGTLDPAIADAVFGVPSEGGAGQPTP